MELALVLAIVVAGFGAWRFRRWGRWMSVELLAVRDQTRDQLGSLREQVGHLQEDGERREAALLERLAEVEKRLLDKPPPPPVIIEREAAPEPVRADRIREFLRTLDHPGDAARMYFEIHLGRTVRTMALVPPAGKTGRALELGAYGHMGPVLRWVLGYREVRGAYLGPVGQTVTKTIWAGGKAIGDLEIDLFNAEKDRYPYPDGHFETVLVCEVFEHLLFDPLHLLLECRRVLEDDGRLVLTTPNVVSKTAVARVLRADANPQLYSQYPHAETETPHVREYTPGELSQAVSAAGFEIEHLFTETPPGYEGNEWVYELLSRNQFPTRLRGEQIFCVARKRPDLPVTRYPGFLYDR